MSSRPLASIAAIVVDDEKLARDELLYLLKDITDVEVVATANNGLEAIELSNGWSRTWSSWTYRCPESTASESFANCARRSPVTLLCPGHCLR